MGAGRGVIPADPLIATNLGFMAGYYVWRRQGVFRRLMAHRERPACRFGARDRRISGHGADRQNRSVLTQNSPRSGCRFALQQTAGPLLDHLVGSAEQRERKRKAKRFSRFEIEDQLDFHRLHHR
jgi:hypothetical protein